MRQLLNVLFGALVMSGYFAYESVLFGTVVWYVWTVFDIGTFTTLGAITWFQAAGILFIIKIIRFDASKIKNQAIVIEKPKEE